MSPEIAQICLGSLNLQQLLAKYKCSQVMRSRVFSACREGYKLSGYPPEIHNNQYFLSVSNAWFLIRKV
jgi:hypothetical protein